MSSISMCRCCLLRPPDKDLKASYTSLGKPEVYADMLKDCFEIHQVLCVNVHKQHLAIHFNRMASGDLDGDGGICEVCITRLRDACEFKQQVQRCQKTMQLQSTLLVKDEITTKVKLELSEEDDDNGIYFLDVKEELSDYEDLRDDDEEDEKKLAEMLGFNEITVKRRNVDQKGRSSKKRNIMAGANGIEKKSKKLATGPLKISIRALSEMNKIIKPAKRLPSIRFINDSMKHKLNIDNILKYSNCTPFSNKTLSGIVCAYCKDTFQKIEDLRNHTRENHTGIDLIDKKRMDKNNLSVKMDITDLKCSTCLASFDVITNLKKHLSKEHDVKFYADVHDYILEFKLTDSEMLNCALCNSAFETFKMLLQHMNGHYRNYICDVCDLGFINKHRLKNHQRTHEVGSFNCTFCDKVFSTRVRKMCHEKYTHNSGARYTTNCPHCDQSFTSYYQRNRHMFKEHNMVAASYKCNICDKSFILKSKLTAHIKKVHLMERNHICAECGQGFFIKQSLDEHMIKHNGERVFKCTVCPKAYARKKTLREHMRIHNNDRRFKCGICALAFVQKCSLKSHMLSNHGVTLAEYETSRSDLCSPESL